MTCQKCGTSQELEPGFSTDFVACSKCGNVLVHGGLLTVQEGGNLTIKGGDSGDGITVTGNLTIHGGQEVA